jgi:outer membrane protein OmpA-like peptidoglycan-associated protein
MKKISLIFFATFLFTSCSSTLTLNDYDHIREVVNRTNVKDYKPKYYDNGGDQKTNILNKKQVAVEKAIIRELIIKEKINISKLQSNNNSGSATANVIKEEINQINRQIENLERRLENISNNDSNAHQEMLTILSEINDLKCRLIDGANRLLIKTNKIYGDVSFSTGQSNVSKRGQEELNKIVSSIETEISDWKNYLNSCNEKVFENDLFVIVIDIEGYADSKGGSIFNLNLSNDRAKEVKKQLEKKFFNLIENKRLKIIFNKLNAKGFGEKLPPGVYQSSGDDPERRICLIYSVVGPSKLLN